ncbi:MAG: hypothetical protein IPM46_16065 [Flavobacteriales bacterium]|nr:hypothetical protein [Flavobacteriales bacterium]
MREQVGIEGLAVDALRVIVAAVDGHERAVALVPDVGVVVIVVGVLGDEHGGAGEIVGAEVVVADVEHVVAAAVEQGERVAAHGHVPLPAAAEVEGGAEGVVRLEHPQVQAAGGVPGDEESAGGPVNHLHHVLLLVIAAGGHEQLAADGDVRAVVAAEVDAGIGAVLLPALPHHHVIVAGPHGQLRPVLVAGHVLVHAELIGDGVPDLRADEGGQQG